MNESNFIPVGNRKFRWKKTGGTRHRRSVCPVCSKSKKNIIYHYKKYHNSWYQDTVCKPLYVGEVGQLYSVRFIETS